VGTNIKNLIILISLVVVGMTFIGFDDSDSQKVSGDIKTLIKR